MSKRRQPGDIVRIAREAGFCGDTGKPLVRIPAVGEDGYDDDPFPCMLDCGDPACMEYANVIVQDGPHAGDWFSHVSECQMEDGETK